MRTVLVTGASGFIGQALCAALRSAGKSLRLVLRPGSEPPADVAGNSAIVRADLDADFNWRPVLQGVDAIVHLAARTHVIHDTASDPLAEYRRINVEATQTLACAAAACSVRRFVFLSSIKVNGDASDAPFSERDAPRPEDAYGQTKWEAEQALTASAVASQLETVVLRPPLVYGPGVKGNFLRLMRAIERGMPLPLGSIRNRRSLLYLDNLIDAIALCLEHRAAAGQTYVLADDASLSTPDLIRSIAAALGKPARLLPFPPALLEAAAAALGKSDAIARLLGSLQVDDSKIKRELGWRPRYSLDEGLGETARWYRRAVNGES